MNQSSTSKSSTTHDLDDVFSKMVISNLREEPGVLYYHHYDSKKKQHFNHLLTHNCVESNSFDVPCFTMLQFHEFFIVCDDNFEKIKEQRDEGFSVFRRMSLPNMTFENLEEEHLGFMKTFIRIRIWAYYTQLNFDEKFKKIKVFDVLNYHVATEFMIEAQKRLPEFLDHFEGMDLRAFKTDLFSEEYFFIDNIHFQILLTLFYFGRESNDFMNDFFDALLYRVRMKKFYANYQIKMPIFTVRMANENAWQSRVESKASSLTPKNDFVNTIMEYFFVNNENEFKYLQREKIKEQIETKQISFVEDYFKIELIKFLKERDGGNKDLIDFVKKDYERLTLRFIHKKFGFYESDSYYLFKQTTTYIISESIGNKKLLLDYSAEFFLLEYAISMIEKDTGFCYSNYDFNLNNGKQGHDYFLELQKICKIAGFKIVRIYHNEEDMYFDMEVHTIFKTYRTYSMSMYDGDDEQVVYKPIEILREIASRNILTEICSPRLLDARTAIKYNKMLLDYIELDDSSGSFSNMSLLHS